MDRPSYPDLVEVLEATELPDGQAYKVGLLSNITLHPMEDVVRYCLSVNGIRANVTTATYDNIVQEATQYNDAKVVVVFWETMNLIQDPDALRFDYTEADYLALLEKIKVEMQLCLEQLGVHPLIVFNRFSSLGLTVDELNSGYIDRLVHELNEYLELLAVEIKNLYLVELDKIIISFGLKESFNWRFYRVSKALYSYPFLFNYVDFLEPVILSAFGKAKKVLVLDCDNTLWEGVLGEEGVSGIKPYSTAQRTFASLAKRGVVVCLCSKNNPEDVDEVFTLRKDMLLTDEHIVLKKVSWGDKATAIREIAAELNLGLDSIVFLDDSNFEVNLVRESLPMVRVYQVPHNEAGVNMLAKKIENVFFNLNSTAEDARKTAMYKSEVKRNEARVCHSNMDAFLRSLDLTVSVSVDDTAHAARFAQLAQKTNQFNLTSKRYLESDIDSMIDSEAYAVVGLSVSDRFGDSGLSGLAIVSLVNEEASIDSMMLSCRVLGRRIEYKFFEALVNVIEKKQITYLKADYIETAKNSQVSDFWPKLGFSQAVVDAPGQTSYLTDLGGIRYPEDTSFIKVIYE